MNADSREEVANRHLRPFRVRRADIAIVVVEACADVLSHSRPERHENCAHRGWRKATIVAGYPDCLLTSAFGHPNMPRNEYYRHRERREVIYAKAKAIAVCCLVQRSKSAGRWEKYRCPAPFCGFEPVATSLISDCREQTEAELAIEAGGDGANNRFGKRELPRSADGVEPDRPAFRAEAMEVDGRRSRPSITGRPTLAQFYGSPQPRRRHSMRHCRTEPRSSVTRRGGSVQFG